MKKKTKLSFGRDDSESGDGIPPLRDLILSRTDTSYVEAMVFRREEAFEVLESHDVDYLRAQEWFVGYMLSEWSLATPPAVENFGPIRVRWFDHAVLISRKVTLRPAKAA